MTTAPTAPNAAAEMQKKRMASLRAALGGDAMRKQFELALPRILPADRFLRALFTTLQRTPELIDCDHGTIIAGAMTAAQLGLEIDPALGRAYLLPYKGKAQLIIGYRGYIDLGYRSGLLMGLQAEVVYERDEFTYELGLDPKLRHVPADLDDRGALRFAYAVAEIKGGGKVWRVLNRSQVMAHKRSSPSAGSKFSPWTSHEAEMWRKTAIRALASVMPQSPELRDAAAHDEAPAGLPAITLGGDAIPTQDTTAEHVPPTDGEQAPPAEQPTDAPKGNPFAGKAAQ